MLRPGFILSPVLLCLLPVCLWADGPPKSVIPEPAPVSYGGAPSGWQQPGNAVVANGPGETVAPGVAWNAPNGTATDADYTGIQAGGSIYFIRPYFNNNVAFTTTTGLGTPSPAQSNEDFHWNYEPAFDVWLGWTDTSGVGGRVRFFRFDQSADNENRSLTPAQAATTTIAPPAGLGNLPGGNFGTPGIVLGSGLGKADLTFGSNLEVDAWDIEATFAGKCDNFSMLVSGGVRFQHLSQNYSATLTNQATAGGANITESQILRFGHNFDGGGPTVSWFGRYEVGNTGLAAFGTVRGSLLVGSGRQDTSFYQQIVDPTGLAGGNQVINPTRTSNFDQVLPVLEIELGVEYGLNVGNSRAFFRAGVVDQTYFNAGNASSNSGDFSLFGAKLSLGVNY